MHHLFIINRFAGKKDSFDLICKQIEDLKLDNYTIVDTECKGDATIKAREFVKNSDDFVNVYACGGDGTFNEVLNGVYDLDNCAIAVVPIGTGNDFVRSFDCPADSFRNLGNLIDGEIKEVDLISCNDKIGANTVSLGYDCAVARNMPKFKRWKFINSETAYIISILYCIFNERKHKFRIVADNKELKRNTKTYLLSVAAKGKYYGGGIKCTPLAEFDDEYLDFLCVDTVGVLKILQLLTTYMKGNHLGDKRFEKIIQHNKFKTIEYISDTPFDIGIDGEIIHTDHAVVTLLPKAQKIIVPKN